MTRLFKLSDLEFKTTIINILKSILDKVKNTQEQMGNVKRETEILRTRKKC